MAKAKLEKASDFLDYCSTLMEGAQVFKKSGKPFKSGDKVNTVNGLIVSPVTKRLSFTFVEDDSFVECRMCERVLVV